MLCYRAVDTTADEEGGGRDEKLFSAGKPLSTETTRKVAMVSQHTIQKDVLDVLRTVI